MENAAQCGRGVLAHPRGHGEQRRGEVEGEGRVAALVRDDRDLVTRLVEGKHRADEIRPVRAEEPRGADDDAVGAAFGDQPFAEQFGAPVGAFRPGRIVLTVRAIERAVEHVVGGQLQQRRADTGGGFRHVAGPLAVDGDGEALLRLGLVDGGVGGGVDHDVRPRRLEPRKNRPAILEQEDAAAKQDDLELATGPLDERGGHLTHRPGDGDPHHVNKSPAFFTRRDGGFVVGCVQARPARIARPGRAGQGDDANVRGRCDKVAHRDRGLS